MKIKALIIAGLLGTALTSQGTLIPYQQDFSGTVTSTMTHQDPLTFGTGQQVEDQEFGYGGGGHYHNTDFVGDL